MATGETAAGEVAPLLDTVGDKVVSNLVDPNPIAELGFCLLILIIIIGVHGWCMGSVSRNFAVKLATVPGRGPSWRISLLVSVTIALLAIAHLFETLIWAIPIWWMNMVPSFRDSYQFVMEAYTTLGEGTVSLPDAWRLVGPMIAISGLFTFSWTGSVLVYVMSESSRRHARDQQHPQQGHSPTPTHQAAAPPVEWTDPKA